MAFQGLTPSVQDASRCDRSPAVFGFSASEWKRGSSGFPEFGALDKNAFAHAFQQADRRESQAFQAREARPDHRGAAQKFERKDRSATAFDAADRPSREPIVRARNDEAKSGLREQERQESDEADRSNETAAAEDTGEICRAEGNIFPVHALRDTGEDKTETPIQDDSHADETASDTPAEMPQDHQYTGEPDSSLISVDPEATPDMASSPNPDDRAMATETDAGLKPTDSAPNTEPAPLPLPKEAANAQQEDVPETQPLAAGLAKPEIAESSDALATDAKTVEAETDLQAKQEAPVPALAHGMSETLSSRSDQDAHAPVAEAVSQAKPQEPPPATTHDVLPEVLTQRQSGTRDTEFSMRAKPDVSEGAETGAEQKPEPFGSGSDSMNNDSFSQTNQGGVAADAMLAGAARHDADATRSADTRQFSEMAGVDEWTKGVDGRADRAPASDASTLFPETAARVAQLQSLVARFGHWVAGALSARGNTMNIHLSPASLGRLTLHCREEQGRLTVDIAAETREARNYLTQHEAEIRAVVQNSGFRMTHFDVHAQGDGSGRRPMYDPEHPGQADNSGRLARRAANAEAWTETELNAPAARTMEPGRMWWVA